MLTFTIPAGTQLVLTGFNFHLEVKVQKYALEEGLRIISLSDGQKMISCQDGPVNCWLLIKGPIMNVRRVRIKGAE